MPQSHRGWSRRELMAALGALPLVGCGRPDPAAEAARRGAAALWALQGDDGGFHGTVYGFLRSGMSLSPLAVLALLALPARLEAAPRDRIGRALTFLVQARAPSGALGLTGGVVDYPVYATGMLLSCLAAVRPPGWQDTAAPSVAWLRSQQLLGGWEGDAGHGGFPMGGIATPPPGTPVHVDLSMTRRAIEGLVAAGVAVDDPALTAARAFVRRCGTADGGFLYSPVEDGVNKGDRVDGRSTGYGSATADGILALLALDGDDLVGPALARLTAIHRVDGNPAVGAAYDGFASAMRGYYRASAGAVFARLGGPTGWQGSLTAAVLAEQRADGTWANELPLQKEDEPVIATAFALQALGAALGG